MGRTRVGGVDPNKPRMRAVLAAVLALALAPGGFSAAQLAARVQATAGSTGGAYGPRQAAYDLKKLRGKHLVTKLGPSRRYQAPPDGLRTIAALQILRDQVIRPLLAGVRARRVGRKPKTWCTIDAHYETLRLDLRHLFHDLGIAAETTLCRSGCRKPLDVPFGEGRAGDAGRAVADRAVGVRAHRCRGLLARTD